MLRASRKMSNLTDSSLIEWNSRDCVNHSFFVFQASIDWISIDFDKTKYRIRENVYLCFRQLDDSDDQSCSSHSRYWIPINLKYLTDFFVFHLDKMSVIYLWKVSSLRRLRSWCSCPRCFAVFLQIIISDILSSDWRQLFCRSFE